MHYSLKSLSRVHMTEGEYLACSTPGIIAGLVGGGRWVGCARYPDRLCGQSTIIRPVLYIDESVGEGGVKKKKNRGKNKSPRDIDRLSHYYMYLMRTERERERERE